MQLRRQQARACYELKRSQKGIMESVETHGRLGIDGVIKRSLEIIWLRCCELGGYCSILREEQRYDADEPVRHVPDATDIGEGYDLWWKCSERENNVW